MGGFKMNQNYNLTEIISHFRLDGKLIKTEPCGQGHINDTFAAYFKKSNDKIQRCILQRINHNVFKTPEAVMANIGEVTNHIRKKIIAAGGDPKRETINLIPSLDNKSYYKCPAGDYWRSYYFIEDAKSYQIVKNKDHFYSAGKTLGRFHQLLSDYPAEKLHETIPNFHNTQARFETFKKAVSDDFMDRTKDVQPEINFVLSRSEDTKVLINLLNQGLLTLKVTHNDTKFNNILIDDITGEGVCLIDLDTVMPGLSLYDFGDSIRSGANPAEEDEKDLSKVCMDLELFEQFTHGFLDSTRDTLTNTEIEYLPFAAKLMTFECGMRFLTDHINGDVYFKISRENHNLDRARTQFKMVADMENKLDEMKKIVDKWS